MANLFTVAFDPNKKEIRTSKMEGGGEIPKGGRDPWGSRPGEGQITSDLAREVGANPCDTGTDRVLYHRFQKLRIHYDKFPL